MRDCSGFLQIGSQLHVQIQIRNYGPTIRTQLVAEDKGHQQVLWLFGEDQQLTEVGTMNLFVHWFNENGGMYVRTTITI